MKKIINLAVLAHVDAGKTTVTENLLYFSGKTRSLGSVDNGNTVTDTSEIEKQRGISVFAEGAELSYNGVTLNLIDTPGHIDFAGEVERSLMSVDAVVVVVSAVEGVQSHTENIMNIVIDNKLPCIVFINKTDRAGSNTGRVLSELREAFGNRFVALTSSENEESKDCKTVKNPDFSENACEVLSEYSDEIMEKYLSDETIHEEELKATLRKLCSEGEVYPVLCGSAMFGVGIPELISAICEYLPDSSKLSRDKLSAVIYKIEHDKTFGVLSHVRMFGGTLSARDTVNLNSSSDTPNADSEVELPLSGERVAAGFPSPAEDYASLSLDLNRELIKNPASTFYARVSGLSMIDEGINDGDLLVIDKSIDPYDGCLAVCYIDGEFTLKRFEKHKDYALLVPANKEFQPLKVTAENDFCIWGVVTYLIKKV